MYKSNAKQILLKTPQIYFKRSKHIDPQIYARAYPEHIEEVKDGYLIWRDGTKMPLADGNEEKKDHVEKLKHSSLLDQISIPYIQGVKGLDASKNRNYDPGRFRNRIFFQKMYGETRTDVQRNLTDVNWLPNIFKDKRHSLNSHRIFVTTVNRVDEIFRKISRELEQLPKTDDILLNKPGKTFRRSRSTKITEGGVTTHKFGIAIDVDIRYSQHWLVDYKKEQNIPPEADIREGQLDYSKFPVFKSKMPMSIVEIFERNDFIWGGKWYHYDCMHFEYRPELFPEHYHL